MRLQLRGYPLDHAGQYFAGTAFHHVADAMLLHALHGFYPPNRAKRLPEKRIADALSVGLFGDIDVVDFDVDSTSDGNDSVLLVTFFYLRHRICDELKTKSNLIFHGAFLIINPTWSLVSVKNVLVMVV